jgi:ABC-type uncharacterized transport system substrate-binding protein
MVGTDPVQAGLVGSLNRPGGNVTGATDLLTELAPKRLELLHEIAPGAMSIGYLYSIGDSAVDEPWIKATENAARILGVRLVKAEAGTPSEIERAFAMLVGERIGALLIGPAPPPATWRGLIALAAYYALPAMYPDSYMVEAGGLLSYTGKGYDKVRLAGTYVGRILKGEKPADLPVQQATGWNGQNPRNRHQGHRRDLPACRRWHSGRCRWHSCRHRRPRRGDGTALERRRGRSVAICSCAATFTGKSDLPREDTRRSVA